MTSEEAVALRRRHLARMAEPGHAEAMVESQRWLAQRIATGDLPLPADERLYRRIMGALPEPPPAA